MGTRKDTTAIQGATARLADMMIWEDDRLYAQVEAVSRWSPAQQLEHIAQAGLAMADMIDLLVAGTPHERVQAAGRPSLAGRVILLLGRIPRGRAQAPDATRPEPVPARAALGALVDTLVARLEARAALAEALRAVPGVGRHPVLGWFTAAQWWRFLRVHTEHHLRIVDDIDRQRLRTVPAAAMTDPLADPSAS